MISNVNHGLLDPVVAADYAVEAHKYLNLFINPAFMDNITIQYMTTFLQENMQHTPCCNSDKLCHAAFPRISQRTSSSSAAQYQRLKQIQNTVRVAASLYTMNLASLSAYQSSLDKTQTVFNSGTPYAGGGGVNWNQMSDRKVPHAQVVVTASRGKSSVKNTITRLRPGAGSPGGIGVDIKHNCYDRYLNRLKAGYLVRGRVPEQYLHDSKNLKTSIVSNSGTCTKCDKWNDGNKNVELLYQMGCDPNKTQLISADTHAVPVIHYDVGAFVWARKCKRLTKKEKAQIISMTGDREQYTVKFSDCCTMVKSYAELQPYVKCAENLLPISYMNHGVVTTCNYLEFKNYQETWTQ